MAKAKKSNKAQAARAKAAGNKTKQRRHTNKQDMVQLLTQLFTEQPEKTFSFKEIFRQLKLNTHPLKMLAIETMEDMAWDDMLTKVGDSAYQLNTSGQVQEGRFVRKPNGKNSVIPDGSDKPIFVSERNSLWAQNGDRVRFSFMARRRNHIKEAQVLEILQRAKDTFVGRLRVARDIAFLVTQDNLIVQDVLVPKDKLMGGKNDDKAVVRITQWPDSNHRDLVGEVIDILGQQGENTAEMHAILAQYGLPYKYPKEVEEAAKKISGVVTAQDLAEREDFRDVWTCTIDPYDAKDFDDALSFRKVGNLYEVGVHIADVSHYVTEGSIIDKEAQKRATSVYLVDRTIPMLPEHLCNFVCSLRPDEEKLCFSVVLLMDEDAQVRSHRVVHTVIKSCRRYAYEEVQELIEKNGVVDGSGQPSPNLYNKDHQLAPHNLQGEYAEQLLMLDMLAKKLRAERFKDGAMKFEGEELHFDVDETGRPIKAFFKRQRDANKLIEEFMLLANRTVAEDIGKPQRGKKAKTLPYRIHEAPDPKKLEDLREFVVRFGYRLKTAGTVGQTARSLNQLMDEAAGQREQKLIQTVALRAMMKAKYSVHNIGHFGLAFPYYTHFTSPIRRYPDTMVHRLLTRYQQGGKSGNERYYEEQCQHSSDMEQLAQQAERESIKYKMVEFMGERIGEVFDAHISGIQSYGIYCEIDENHCEGMVPMRDLDDDYYDFDEKNYCLVGRRHHNKYQLGDPIRIRVAAANLKKRQLDFTIEKEEP
ncbi:MAG: ribonuclease R [Prevotella sp.]|nr:ribonuclease R [Prevotella sp.]